MPAVGKIAKLPAELREWLHKAIVERGYGDIVALTQELNALCKEGGVAVTVGKSAVGLESQKVKRAQEAIKATTEAAKLLADTSRDDGDTRSEATFAIIQTDIFEALLLAREAETEEDPVARIKVLSKSAEAMAKLSRARVNQAKWRTDVEAKAKAAADAVSKIAKKGGLSAAQVSEIRSSILGIVPKQAT